MLTDITAESFTIWGGSTEIYSGLDFVLAGPETLDRPVSFPPLPSPFRPVFCGH